MQKPVISDSCIACGTCVAICPDVFEMGDSKAAVKEADYVSFEGKIDESIAACPSQAISKE